MRPVVLLLAGSLTVGGMLPSVGASPTAGGTDHSWAVDGVPFGPNAAESADRSRIVIQGDGTLASADATVRGGGRYRILDRAGTEVVAGTWKTLRVVSFQDQGSLFPAVEHGRKGILVLRAVFSGVGRGTITIYCHAEPDDVEGVRVRLGRRAFDAIVAGSTTLLRDGGVYAGAMDEGGLPD